MLTLSKNDSILILAPHPDDETIGCGGVLQEALRLNLPVKIVYFTNGDNNEMSFILYEKRLVMRREEFIKMGEMRRMEAVSAMKLLGIDRSQTVFLGYPDFGTMHILKEHWGDTEPFKSMLTRVTKVPYPECLSPGAPYSGESILRDLENIFVQFKPTKIFCSNPVDLNVDHRALYIFMQVALRNVKDKIEYPEVFPYLVHAAKWPDPKGYYPDLEEKLPPQIVPENIQLAQFVLSDEMVKKKKEIISCYKSQALYNPLFLESFARKTEIFFNYPALSVKRHGEDEIEWRGLEKICDIRSHVFNAKDDNDRQIKSMVFAEKNGFLYVKVNLQRLIDKERGTDINFFGYKDDTSFAVLPKLRMHIGWRNKLEFYEGKNPILVPEAELSLGGGGLEIIVKIPLMCLDYPGYIFTSCKTHSKDLPQEISAWRILVLSQDNE